jgi:hypothetical protein
VYSCVMIALTKKERVNVVSTTVIGHKNEKNA